MNNYKFMDEFSENTNICASLFVKTDFTVQSPRNAKNLYIGNPNISSI